MYFLFLLSSAKLCFFCLKNRERSKESTSLLMLMLILSFANSIVILNVSKQSEESVTISGFFMDNNEIKNVFLYHSQKIKHYERIQI